MEKTELASLLISSLNAAVAVRGLPKNERDWIDGSYQLLLILSTMSDQAVIELHARNLMGEALGLIKAVPPSRLIDHADLISQANKIADHARELIK